MLSLVPLPLIQAAGDEGGGGGESSTTVIINGGNNTVGPADNVSVSTTVTNITSNNTTVYVSGDYYENSTYLFYPRISEMHMLNNSSNALWNPTTDELPGHLYASVMQQAGISILYDGWIDLEHKDSFKPSGATRAGEVLGYDIYARLGEVYNPVVNSYSGEVDQYIYETGGLYDNNSKVNCTWALTQLYRAVGIEKSQYYVLTEPAPENYDINRSPIASLITMDTMGPDLSAAVSKIAATRTDPTPYLELAIVDALGVAIAEDRETQYLSIADFCTLAYRLMQLYGEPVLTPQETFMLLDIYGAQLPYGLPSLQLESIEYLMARGIVESDMDWRSDITFQDAADILMRIKDEGSRLTFKDIELTTSVELLQKGYYATEVSTYESPIEVLDVAVDYTTYTDYDYFIEITDCAQFRSESGYMSIPFVGAGKEYNEGVRTDATYIGRADIDGKSYYHFRVPQDSPSLAVNASVYVNTPVANDCPAKYALPAPAGGNTGGVWTYTGDLDAEPGCTTIVSTWAWQPLGDSFPTEYCDKARKEAAAQESTAQLSILNASTYGYTFRIYQDDLSQVKFKDSGGTEKTLADVDDTAVDLGNGMKLSKLQLLNRYQYFEVTGCSNKDTLSELFTCSDGGQGAYQAFPAFAKHDGRYLVSVDYLKALGMVWEFSQTGEHSYYLGVQVDAADASSAYSSVYIGTSGTHSFVIRGSQLTLYDEDTVVVLASDTGYFVDYSAVMGVANAVSFPTQDGKITLSRASSLDGVDINAHIYNMNSTSNNSSSGKAWETGATVEVAKGSETRGYMYCPVDYPLANWLVVDNKVDGQSGVFTFYATAGTPDKNSTGAKALEQMLGLSNTSTKWEAYYTPIAPGSTVKVESGKYSLDAELKDWPAVAYIKESDAYLVRTNNPTTYGDFVNNAGADNVTSIIYSSANSSYVDWNYNIYGKSKTQVWRFKGPLGNMYSDCAQFQLGSATGTGSMGTSTARTYATDEQIPAPAGIPGMIGYPASVSNTTSHGSTHVYEGIAYKMRGVNGSASGQDSTLPYCIIHATPKKTILQSCGFTFTYLDNSPLDSGYLGKLKLLFGDALAGFDWDQFFKDLNLENADDWLTIAIITVLRFMPRFFMFLFMLLMALAMLANAKPWIKFCDSVFDPYKLITAGRQTVHTIQLKRIFLYSLIALCLYGFFQNGLILNVIAWIARGVTGILVR